jgi:hypothetical protein
MVVGQIRIQIPDVIADLHQQRGLIPPDVLMCNFPRRRGM